jgi:hypothetical protein
MDVAGLGGGSFDWYEEGEADDGSDTLEIRNTIVTLPTKNIYFRCHQEYVWL